MEASLSEQHEAERQRWADEFQAAKEGMQSGVEAAEQRARELEEDKVALEKKVVGLMQVLELVNQMNAEMENLLEKQTEGH